MYCENCGAELGGGAKFCPNCGSALGGIPSTAESGTDSEPKRNPTKPAVKQRAAQSEKVSENITRGADGKYRWVYEMNLFKNAGTFLLVWKIFFFIILGMFAFLVLIQSGGRGFWWDGFWDTAKVFGYILVGMTALSALGYLLYAAIMGGKYIVEFEMDEKGILHKQTAAQAKKAKKLGRATMLAGAASGRVGTVGVGMNAQRTEMYSDFAKVRKVKAYPRRGLIKANERLEHNQVYAAKEDFAFVENYIVSHCVNMKK